MPPHHPLTDPEPPRDLLHFEPVEREPDHRALLRRERASQGSDVLKLVSKHYHRFWPRFFDWVRVAQPHWQHHPSPIIPLPNVEDVPPRVVLADLPEATAKGVSPPRPPLRPIPPSSQDEAVVGRGQALVARHGDATAESEAGRPLGDLEIKRGEGQ